MPYFLNKEHGCVKYSFEVFKLTSQWQRYLFNEGKNRSNICMVLSKNISDWHLPIARGRRHHYFPSSNSLGAMKKPASLTQPVSGTSWPLSHIFQCKSNSGLWVRWTINEINKFWMAIPDHWILHYGILRRTSDSSMQFWTYWDLHHHMGNSQHLAEQYPVFESCL